MSVQKLNIVDIDLNSGNIHRSWNLHSIGKADNKANAFGVRVFRNGAAEDLSGVSVQGYFRDPQGNNVAITSGNTVEDNVAYVVLPQACYNYDGQYCLAIKLIGGGITGTVRIVDGMVDNTNTGGAVAPTETVPTYQEILAVYGEMQETIEDYDETVASQNDQISTLKNSLFIDINSQSIWEQGGLYTTDGTTFGGNQRIRTPVITEQIKAIHVKSGYKYMVFAYLDGTYIGILQADKTYSKTASWYTTDVWLDYSSGYSFRIEAGKTDDSTITTSAYSNVCLYVITDRDLKKIGVPADAMETGTKIGNIENQIKNTDYSEIPFINAGSGYIAYSNGNISSSSVSGHTDYVDVSMYKKIKYKRMGYTNAGTVTGMAFYNDQKTYISGITNLSSQPSQGYLEELYETNVPANAKYARFTIFADTNTYGNFAVYGISNISSIIKDIEGTIRTITEYADASPYATRTGVLLSDGTINSTFTNIPIKKIRADSERYILDGYGNFDTDESFCYVWFVNEGSMVSYIAATSKPQTFENVEILADDSFDEIWICGNNIRLLEGTAIDKQARAMISGEIIGSQWKGKTWYAYGTSITNISNEGKYPNYLAEMSGMTLVNKGISGGGIGDLGGYSHGQVYSAICNITDGKLNADLITLETGANDTGAGVPLGTVYDTGRSTLAGCLNDCLRYLQENTNAQIAVTVSPATKTEPNAENQYYEWAKMVEEICHINRVHYMNADNNMGNAKLTSDNGSMYVVDNIHQTNLGGYIMAQNLWYQLRNIPCFLTAIPT